MISQGRLPILTGRVRLPAWRSESISLRLLIMSTSIEMSPHTLPAQKEGISDEYVAL